MNMVRFKKGETPKLSEEYMAEVDALFKRPDSEIDYSDIPEVDEAFLRKAVRNPLYKPTKTPAYIRLDSDVLVWLKQKGRGYQSRLNAILRDAMIRELRHDH